MASSIWFKKLDLHSLNLRGLNTMAEHLGIEFIEIGDRFLKATMPVDRRTVQPRGILHGGASVALAETIASTGGNLVVNPELEYCVGLEINANHISSCNDGIVSGTSTPLHLGKKTQVWETKIFQRDRLVSVGRMTLAVLTIKK